MISNKLEQVRGSFEFEIFREMFFMAQKCSLESLNDDLVQVSRCLLGKWMARCYPRQLNTVTCYMVLFNIDQRTVRDCLPEVVFCFLGFFFHLCYWWLILPSSWMIPGLLVPLDHSWVMNMKPFHPHLRVLKFLFLIKVGHWSQPWLVNWQHPKVCLDVHSP